MHYNSCNTINIKKSLNTQKMFTTATTTTIRTVV